MQKVEAGAVTSEEYRDTAQGCKGIAWKARTHLQLYLERDVKGNKRGFSKSIGDKKAKGNVGLLLSGAGVLVTQDMQKAEGHNAFFTSGFHEIIEMRTVILY